jgi:hypothetical protein
VDSLLLTGNTPAGAAAKLAHYGLDDHLFDGGFCADTDDREAIARRAWELAEREVAVASGPFGREDLEAAEPWLLLDDLPDPDRFADLLGLPERQPRRARA